MLILGTTATKPVIDTGSFACPHCETQRAYERRQIRQWFTVYFIPVIPLGSQGEILRCTTCRNEYDAMILTGNSTSTGPASEDFAEALLVLAAVDRGQPGPEMTRTLQQLLSELRGEPVSSETVAGLIQKGTATRLTPIEYAGRVRDQISLEDRIRVVVLMDELVRCDGDEHPGGLALLEGVAHGLGLSPSDLERLLARLDES